MFEYIAFDTETTGISVYEDVIIEIGAVRFVKGAPADTFNVLIDPRRSIPAEATRVHGITNAMVKGQSTLEAALEGFTAFCQDSVLVAHNAPFDIKFIAAAGISEQMPLPQGLILDTFPMAKAILPDLFNHKLETLVKHFGIKPGEFHRASADAAHCGKVFIGLLKQLKANGGALKFQNLLNLSGGENQLPFIEPKARQIGMF